MLKSSAALTRGLCLFLVHAEGTEGACCKKVISHGVIQSATKRGEIGDALYLSP